MTRMRVIVPVTLTVDVDSVDGREHPDLMYAASDAALCYLSNLAQIGAVVNSSMGTVRKQSEGAYSAQVRINGLKLSDTAKAPDGTIKVERIDEAPPKRVGRTRTAQS